MKTTNWLHFAVASFIQTCGVFMLILSGAVFHRDGISWMAVLVAVCGQCFLLLSSLIGLLKDEEQT